ncbi:MAG: biosynthetic-type acetolactate synthase large subunit [Coriobacteriales bacterium]|nr:biosynthetic-type acetolactate synthase large subunit [Coriobacteriales bacterium]
MELKGSDIVVKTLIVQGCTTVFGYPGGTVIDIYDSLFKYADQIEHVLVTHEQQAAHAADGYARALGKVGVCLATSGPGSTNLVTGIATAFLDSIPLIAITGNVSTRQIGTDSFQELDITGVTLPITKHNYFISAAREIAPVMREAFKLAKSGRPGPVLIDIARDAQESYAEFEPEKPVEPQELFAAPSEAIKAAAACINRARCPFIYYGGGVTASGAAQEVVELARKINAPMGCSLMGISAVPQANAEVSQSNEMRFLGMEGMHGHYASSMAMAHADCIIALGVRFNDRSTGDRATFAPGARIVHIDIDASELSKNLPDDHPLLGDLKLTLQKLIPLINKAEHIHWQAEINEYLEEEHKLEDVREGLTPKNIFQILQGFLTPGTPVVTDVGQHQMWAAQMLKFEQPRTFISNGGLGTMGFSLGASVGAAIATGKRVVTVMGDGGFGMCMNELATAVTHELPLVILVFNNGVLGMVRQQQRFMCDKRYSGVELNRKTDIVAVAKAFGADGMRVSGIDDLNEALEHAFAAQGPYLIECMINKEELVLPMMVPGGSMNDLIVKAGD